MRFWMEEEARIQIIHRGELGCESNVKGINQMFGLRREVFHTQSISMTAKVWLAGRQAGLRTNDNQGVS